MYALYFTVLSFFSSFALPQAHEFHLSKTLIEYNEQERALQITMHIFIDDLEEALRQMGHDKLFICTKKEAADAEKQMEKYLRKQFQLSVNQRSVEYTFLGKEVSDDLMGVWCYLEVLNIDQLKQLDISNNILLEIYDDQKNVTQIVGPQKREGYFIFQKGQSSDSVNF